MQSFAYKINRARSVLSAHWRREKTYKKRQSSSYQRHVWCRWMTARVRLMFLIVGLYFCQHESTKECRKDNKRHIHVFCTFQERICHWPVQTESRWDIVDSNINETVLFILTIYCPVHRSRWSDESYARRSLIEYDADDFGAVEAYAWTSSMIDQRWTMSDEQWHHSHRRVVHHFHFHFSWSRYHTSCPRARSYLVMDAFERVDYWSFHRFHHRWWDWESDSAKWCFDDASVPWGIDDVVDSAAVDVLVDRSTEASRGTGTTKRETFSSTLDALASLVAMAVNHLYVAFVRADWVPMNGDAGWVIYGRPTGASRACHQLNFVEQHLLIINFVELVEELLDGSPCWNRSRSTTWRNPRKTAFTKKKKMTRRRCIPADRRRPLWRSPRWNTRSSGLDSYDRRPTWQRSNADQTVESRWESIWSNV